MKKLCYSWGMNNKKANKALAEIWWVTDMDKGALLFNQIDYYNKVGGRSKNDIPEEVIDNLVDRFLVTRRPDFISEEAPGIAYYEVTPEGIELIENELQHLIVIAEREFEDQKTRSKFAC